MAALIPVPGQMLIFCAIVPWTRGNKSPVFLFLIPNFHLLIEIPIKSCLPWYQNGIGGLRHQQPSLFLSASSLAPCLATCRAAVSTLDEVFKLTM